MPPHSTSWRASDTPAPARPEAEPGGHGQEPVGGSMSVVRCGPIDANATAAPDPVIVVEVLSQGTAQHDLTRKRLTRKRLAYKTIPSLCAILYVHQDRLRIDLVRRQPDGRWDDADPAEGMAA